jgi:hypothetical protein
MIHSSIEFADLRALREFLFINLWFRSDSP